MNALICGKLDRCFSNLRSSILLLLIVLGPVCLSAQTGSISGTVTDEQGARIPFVGVVLGTNDQSVIADAKGEFQFSDLAQGSYTIRFTSVGHATTEKQVNVTSGAVTRIEQPLAESVVDLKAFAVLGTITGGSGPSRTMAGSAWYIGPKEIQAQATTDIHRLLRSVPGVNIQEEDGFGLRPNIGLRGAGSERSSKITLMEDGVLVAPAPYASPAAYYFPVIGRMHAVEVMKGSSQVRYGPLTTGGAVNLISTPVPEKEQAMLGIWGGSFGTRNLHANAGATVGRHQFLAETFQQGADGFKHLSNGGNTGFDKQDYLGKWQWTSSDSGNVQHAIAVKGGYTKESSNETYLGLTSTDFANDPYMRYAGSAKDNMRSEHDLASVRYALRLKNGPEVAATLYRTNTFRNWYKLDKVTDSTGTSTGISDLLSDPQSHSDALNIVRGSTSADDALSIKANNRNYRSSGAQLIVTHMIEREKTTHGLEAGVRLHNDYMDRFQWTDGWRMNNGELYQTSSGVPGTESNRIATADAIAAHAAYDVDFGRLAIHPGIRYEHIVMAQDDYGKQDPGRTGNALVTTTNTVDVWIPGIGADIALSNSVGLFAGVHKGFSPPGVQPGTLPESSINYELGVRVERTGLNVQLIGFMNNYSEMLGSDLAAAGGSGTGDLFNAGKAVVQGVEFYANWDVLNGLSTRMRMPLSVAYTFTDARFGSSFNSSFEPWGNVLEGDRIPYTPAHQINGRLDLVTGKFTCGVSANYQSEVATVTGSLNDANAMIIAARMIVDANASYRFNTHFEVFSTVANLGNTVYEAAQLPAGSRPGMPRLVQGGVRLRF
jgi:Fe(3+) dicitrate transport protein